MYYACSIPKLAMSTCSRIEMNAKTFAKITPPTGATIIYHGILLKTTVWCTTSESTSLANFHIALHPLLYFLWHAAVGNCIPLEQN